MTEYESLINRIYTNKLTDYDLSILRPNISEFFYSFCHHGHKDAAEWLYNFKKVNSNIDSDIDLGYAFLSSCTNGHKHIVEWLYELFKTDYGA